jgi:hypothetical protein
MYDKSKGVEDEKNYPIEREDDATPATIDSAIAPLPLPAGIRFLQL